MGWRPTAEGDARTAGFHLSSLYSAVGWFSWADAAEMYEQAQKAPDLRRNEALDCRVYARAAAAIYGLNRFEERHWRRMEEALARTVEGDDHGPASPPAPVAHQP